MDKTITQARLNELLAYDAATGTFAWKRTRRGSKAQPGDVAGTLKTRGDISISVDGRLYKAHRLAWFMMMGRWPKNDIDHADGDKTNNRITNLRDATRSQNNANRHGHGAHPKGVDYESRLRKRPYRAKICVNRKIMYLGRFSTSAEAHTAYAAAAKRYFGAFAKI